MQRKLEQASVSESAIENEYWDEQAFLNARKEEVWRSMPQEIYCIFWYASLQDLLVPSKHYKEEIESISKKVTALQPASTTQSGSRMTISISNPQLSTAEQKSNKKEIEKLQKLQKALTGE